MSENNENATSQGTGQATEVPWYRSASWFKEFSVGGQEMLTELLGPGKVAGEQIGKILARLVTSERKLKEVERIFERTPMTNDERLHAIKAVLETTKDV